MPAPASVPAGSVSRTCDLTPEFVKNFQQLEAELEQLRVQQAGWTGHATQAAELERDNERLRGELSKLELQLQSHQASLVEKHTEKSQLQQQLTAATLQLQSVQTDLLGKRDEVSQLQAKLDELANQSARGSSQELAELKKSLAELNARYQVSEGKRRQEQQQLEALQRELEGLRDRSPPQASSEQIQALTDEVTKWRQFARDLEGRVKLREKELRELRRQPKGS